MKRELPWVLYAVVLVIAIVPVLYVRSDDFSTAWVVFCLAQLGLGLGVARPWVAVPALVTSAMLVMFIGFGGWGWVLLVCAAPFAAGLAIAGWGVALLLGRGALPASIVVFAIALAPGAAGIADAVDHATAEHVSPVLRRQLPLEYSLGNLCPNAQTPKSLEARIRREAEVLLRELKHRPDALVSYTYEYEDADPVTKDITIRRLAEDQLEDLTASQHCAPELRERLQDALQSLQTK